MYFDACRGVFESGWAQAEASGFLFRIIRRIVGDPIAPPRHPSTQSKRECGLELYHQLLAWLLDFATLAP